MSLILLDKNAHSALCGSESWEISAHPTDPSVITDREEKERRLNETYPKFPLLFKVINARTQLSVQVHSNEETCKVTGGEPKTEMWCALSDGPIYAGLREGTIAADVEAAVESGRFEKLLVRHEAKFGDVFFISGGFVHAIGDGVKSTKSSRISTRPSGSMTGDASVRRLRRPVAGRLTWKKKMDFRKVAHVMERFERKE